MFNCAAAATEARADRDILVRLAGGLTAMLVSLKPASPSSRVFFFSGFPTGRDEDEDSGLGDCTWTRNFLDRLGVGMKSLSPLLDSGVFLFEELPWARDFLLFVIILRKVYLVAVGIIV